MKKNGAMIPRWFVLELFTLIPTGCINAVFCFFLGGSFFCSRHFLFSKERYPPFLYPHPFFSPFVMSFSSEHTTYTHTSTHTYDRLRHIHTHTRF
ncbi:hypothetical protein B0T20DRAFT_83859 [Sordaria brevicollis]|uniref:Uncharacterized protein n=1 Tax=Sordaria brevicollis TaxID=83679 RepID=A0AAE0P1E4_SORBR|nr:hypothetical protein B0T20DRAFT_83859 [Sordaria brevicollis]